MQQSRREGKRVRTKSYYIGPVGASLTALKLGVKLATEKAVRDRLLGPVEFKERREAAPSKVNFGRGDELGFQKGWTAEQSFQHESGIKNASDSGGVSPSASDGATEQPSAPESGSDPAN